MKCDSFWLSRCIKLLVPLILYIGMAVGCATDTGIRPAAQDSQQVDVPKQITGIQVYKRIRCGCGEYSGQHDSVLYIHQAAVSFKRYFVFSRDDVSDVTPATPADADMIGDIAVSRVGDALTTKVEIALTKDVPYQVQREGNILKVSFVRKTSEASVNVTAPSIRETPISESSLSSTAGSAAGPPLSAGHIRWMLRKNPLPQNPPASPG